MKTPLQSKVVWFAGLLTILGTLNALFGAIDMTKLPPDVQKWLLPVVGLVTLLARLVNSNLKVNP